MAARLVQNPRELEPCSAYTVSVCSLLLLRRASPSIIPFHALLFQSWHVSLSIFMFLNVYYPPSQVKLQAWEAQTLPFPFNIVSVVTSLVPGMQLSTVIFVGCPKITRIMKGQLKFFLSHCVSITWLSQVIQVSKATNSGYRKRMYQIYLFK